MRKLQWAFAALSAVVLTVAAESSALGQPPGGKPVDPPTAIDVNAFGAPPAGFRSWSDVLQVQERLDAKAERILAKRDGAYAGIVVEADKRKLTVHWKGTPPGAAGREIAEARRGDNVEVVTAPYSEAELVAEASRVAKTPGVTAVSPKADGTGLIVSTAPNAKPPITSTVPLTTDTAAPQAASRLDDSPPYWGGARWTAGGSCTSGYAIRIGGVSKMLSAGHCAANGNTALDGGGQVMGTVSGDNNARDILYINASSGGRIFNGGVGSGEFSNRVVGASRSFVGDFICTSGSFSGTRCNERVVAVNQTVNIGYLVFPTVRAEQLDHTNAIGNGDSGGPVLAVPADTTTVIAKGTNTAIDLSTQVACTGVPSSSTRRCAWRFWYVDIIDSLNWYGGQIITS